MNLHKYFSWMLSCFLMVMIVSSAQAKPDSTKSRFSHKGIKVAVGSGSVEMTSERQLEEGEGGLLCIGYGFTNRFTLWLTLLGSEHTPIKQTDLIQKFSGLELNIQHKFDVDDRLQPYGKLGFGLYGLESQQSATRLVGAGVNLAFGLDYFFSKHFGVGAELMYKKLDYYLQSTKAVEGEFVTELNPDLNGDTVALMITFTIQ
ncbi:MAG: outer membrane beta-barrel protein [bacterium]